MKALLRTRDALVNTKGLNTKHPHLRKYAWNVWYMTGRTEDPASGLLQRRTIAIVIASVAGRIELVEPDWWHPS